MRKTTVVQTAAPDESLSTPWLDLEELASIEITSEDPLHPFEDALFGAAREGWRASTPGRQLIRLIFDEPISIQRIRLEFREEGPERAQEFALYVISPDQIREELVRQQWTFSPGGSTLEVEDYRVELADVAAVELQIDPGRHDTQRVATLQSIAIA